MWNNYEAVHRFTWWCYGGLLKRVRKNLAIKMLEYEVLHAWIHSTSKSINIKNKTCMHTHNMMQFTWCAFWAKLVLVVVICASTFSRQQICSCSSFSSIFSVMLLYLDAVPVAICWYISVHWWICITQLLISSSLRKALQCPVINTKACLHVASTKVINTDNTNNSKVNIF